MNTAQQKTAHEALLKAIEVAGDMSKLARSINKGLPSGVKPIKNQNVWWWVNRSKKISPLYVNACVDAVSGCVKASELRPDLYPTNEQE